MTESNQNNMLKDDEHLWIGKWCSISNPSQFGGEMTVVLTESQKPYKSYGYLAFDRGMLADRSFKCVISYDPRHKVLVGEYKVAGVKKFIMTMKISFAEAGIMIGEYTGTNDNGTWMAELSDKRSLNDQGKTIDDEIDLL